MLFIVLLITSMFYAGVEENNAKEETEINQSNSLWETFTSTLFEKPRTDLQKGFFFVIYCDIFLKLTVALLIRKMIINTVLKPSSILFDA